MKWNREIQMEHRLLLDSLTEDEIIVSQILLDLKRLLSLSESLKFNWGLRRRRSCFVPLPLPPPPENRIEAEAAEDEKHDGAARTTASPNTPLSFSLSDCDEKSKHYPKKNLKKRAREEYMDMIEGLTRRKEQLAGAIDKVKKYYNELKAENSQLKATKQQVLKLGEKRAKIGGANLGVELTRYYRGNLGNGSALGIDLNLPAEEAFGVDLYRPLDDMADKRARFAEARRKRMRVMKSKSKKKN